MMCHNKQQNQKKQIRIEKISEGLQYLENKHFDNSGDTEKYYEVFYKTLKNNINDITHDEIDKIINTFSNIC